MRRTVDNSFCQTVCGDGTALPRGTRVVFIFDQLELGGAERQALLFARYMRDVMESHIEVVGFSTPGRLTSMCNDYGIPWHLIPVSPLVGRRRILIHCFRLARQLKSLQPDLLMPYTMHPNVMCCAVWRLTGAKACIWNQRDEGRQRVGRFLEWLAVRQASGFVSNSRVGAEFLAETLGVRPRRVATIHNGVYLEPAQRDRGAWRKELGVDDTCVVCTMIANLHHAKDHATLLNSWRLVVDRFGSGAMLLLAGRPSGKEDELADLVRKLGLGESVRFLGAVNDVAGLIAATDIGVHSSVREGCPNGILELMLGGRPVVGTDIDAIRDVVGPDGYAFLAPAGDAQALADRICHLAGSPDLRMQLGRSNAQRAQKEFSTEAMCERMSEAVGDILMHGRR